MADGAGPTPSGRPAELEGFLNAKFYHPLARQLAIRLAPTRVSPNAVSIAGGLCVVAASAAYAAPGWPLTVLLALGLHMSWHILDGADGDLARLTGKASPTGELVDGLADYLSHIVLYLVLGAVLMADIGTLAWVLTVAAGASRIVQSNFYESRRRQYECWKYHRPWLGTKPYDGSVAGAPVLAALARAYLSLSVSIGRGFAALGVLYDQTRDDPDAAERFRRCLLKYVTPTVRRMHPLGANQRTIVLGLSMLARSPIYYFVYEIALLNLVLLWSIRANNRAARLTAAGMRQA